jgi:hypothetical protein
LKQLETYTQGNLYKLRWDTGGEMPDSLKASWTSGGAALKAATHYMNTRVVRKPKTQVKVDGKGKSRA